eukprot:ANDGO_03955.mRNA.1 CTL-like protein DDB_G0288717
MLLPSDGLDEPLVSRRVREYTPPSLQNSRVRHMTDSVFLLLFLTSLVVLLCLFASTFSRARPSRQPHGAHENGLTNSLYALRSDMLLVCSTTAIVLLLAYIWVSLLAYHPIAVVHTSIFAAIVFVYAVATYALLYAHLAIALPLYTLGSALLAAVLALRHRIAFACVLIRQACGAIKHRNQATTLLLNIAPILITAFLITTALIIITAVSIYAVPGADSLRYSLLFLLFEYFWIANVLLAVFQVTVAAAVSAHLYDENHQTLPLYHHDNSSTRGGGGEVEESEDEARGKRQRIWEAFTTAVTYNAGTVCFAGLVLAIVSTVTVVLRIVVYVRTKTSGMGVAKGTAVGTAVGDGVQRVLEVSVVVLEAVRDALDVASGFAMVYVGMYGLGLRDAASQVHRLATQAGCQALVTYSVASFVLFCGELVGMCVALFLTVRAQASITTVLLCVFVAFVVFRTLSHAVRIAADTVLVCYMEDVERLKDILMPGKTYSIGPEVHEAVIQAKLAIEASSF